jgi:hypothetical protein
MLESIKETHDKQKVYNPCLKADYKIEHDIELLLKKIEDMCKTQNQVEETVNCLF